MSLYAVTHATCGHSACISGDRAQVEAVKDRLHAAGQHRWRVVVIPDHQAQEAAVTGMLDSDPRATGCGTCNLGRGHVTLRDVPQVDIGRIHDRLGRTRWQQLEVGADGAAWRRRDGTRSIIVSVSRDYPDNPDGAVWVHASISAHPDGAPVPAYEELAELRAAVWGEDGWAFQVFAPPCRHVNIRGNALHLWGRADGARTHPDFGWTGTI